MADRIIDLPILGMVRSTSFANNIARGIKRRQGIIEATVDIESEEISILFDTEKTTVRNLVDNLRQIGYDVAHEKVDMTIVGIKDREGAQQLEKAIKEKVEGVIEAVISFSSDRLDAEYISFMCTVNDILLSIESSGHSVEGMKAEAEENAAPESLPEPEEATTAIEEEKEATPEVSQEVDTSNLDTLFDKPMFTEEEKERPAQPEPTPKVEPTPVAVSDQAKKGPPPPAERIIDLPLLGVSSEENAKAIEECLETVDGVGAATVSFDVKKASVLYSTQKSTVRPLVECIRSLGYDIDLERLKAKKS